MGNLDGARDLLRSLHSFPINDTWRTILEGALMEGRTGNVGEARRVFDMLMEKVPWSGQIYLEAAKLEERQHAYQSALTIVHRGLSEQPRFGHLWFAGFRLNEMIEVDRRMKWFNDACRTWASCTRLLCEVNSYSREEAGRVKDRIPDVFRSGQVS